MFSSNKYYCHDRFVWQKSGLEGWWEYSDSSCCSSSFQYPLQEDIVSVQVFIYDFISRELHKYHLVQMNACWGSRKEHFWTRNLEPVALLCDGGNVKKNNKRDIFVGVTGAINNQSSAQSRHEWRNPVAFQRNLVMNGGMRKRFVCFSFISNELGFIPDVIWTYISTCNLFELIVYELHFMLAVNMNI